MRSTRTGGWRLKVVVAKKGHLWVLQVNFDEVDVSSVAEQLQGAAHVNLNERQVLAEYRLVEGQVVVVLEFDDATFVVAEHCCFRHALGVASGEQGTLPAARALVTLPKKCATSR